MIILILIGKISTFKLLSVLIFFWKRRFFKRLYEKLELGLLQNVFARSREKIELCRSWGLPDGVLC